MSRELKLQQKVALKSSSLMQQRDFNALIYEEEHKLNRSKKEEIVLRYKSTSPPYY